jgi:tetratricopeptide (TPR) repeat protein
MSRPGSKSRVLAGPLLLAALLAVSACGRTPEELVARGDLFMARGDVSPAVIAYGRALKERPDDVELIAKIADIHRMRGEHEKATESYERLLELAPDRHRDRLALTGIEADEGLWRRVGENLPILLAHLPREASVHKLAARLAEQARDLDRALADWRRAAELDPRDPRVQHAIGRILSERQDWEGAVRAFQRAARIDPGYTEAQFELGLILIELGRIDEAERAYRRYIDQHPRDAEPYYRLGNALFSKGYVSKAVEQYQRALTLRPEYGEAWFNLGMAQLKTGRRPDARTSFENAIIWSSNEELKETARRMLRDLVNGHV